jgi:hypothetical protein
VSNGVTEREVVSVEVSGDKALVRDRVAPFPQSAKSTTSAVMCSSRSSSLALGLSVLLLALV